MSRISSKTFPILCVAFSSLIVGTQQACGDIILTTVGVAVTENYNDYRGTGFTPAPASGQLDSDTYRAVGFSDGDGTFGGTFTTGDFARGTSPGGVTTGGTYAFEVGGSGTGDFAVGIQPTGGDFTDGSLTIRVSNQTGQDISAFGIEATGYFLNNAGRSSRWIFEFSLDDSNYVQFAPSLDSPVDADAVPAWVGAPIGGIVPFGTTVANGNQFFLRITGDDLSGTGSRDEFALDNLSLTAVPEPSSFAVLGVFLLSLNRRRSRNRG